MSARSVRWGIIGCGDVTEVKSGPGFQKATGSELVAVMRRDGEKAADYARRHGVARWYDDGEKLIADPLVDAVYIATPPGTHEMYAMKVCAAGKPCYVEKPFSRNAPEARRMVDAFAAKKLPLFVAYYRRSLPRFVNAKQIIDSGMLGKIHIVEYRYTDSQMCEKLSPIPWRLQAEHAGGGLFLDLGSHVLDLLDFLLGPLTGSNGHSKNAGKHFDVEDEVSLNFTAGAAIGSATWNFIAEHREDEFRIVGEDAELKFSCFSNAPLTIKRKDGRVETQEIPHPPHVQQPLIQTIVDELRRVPGMAGCPSTGVTALRTQEIMDIPLVGFYGGREDGFWKRMPVKAT
jgi:predicted dehydrogenase